MFPLKDENPTEITPYVTVVIIAINVAVWLFLQKAGTGIGFFESLCAYGAIPGEITGAIPEASSPTAARRSLRRSSSWSFRHSERS